MAISGRYYIKMWIPNPRLVHGDPTPEMLAKMKEEGPPPAPPKVPSDDVQVALADHGKPGEDFFEGKMLFDFTPNEDGTLSGNADGAPIHWGFYSGDEFFKVGFSAGPGQWEVWARVLPDGAVEGLVSVGGGKGFPNLVYGAKLPD